MLCVFVRAGAVVLPCSPAWMMYGIVGHMRVAGFARVLLVGFLYAGQGAVVAFPFVYLCSPLAGRAAPAPRDAGRCGPICKPARPSCQNSFRGHLQKPAVVTWASAGKPAKHAGLPRANLRCMRSPRILLAPSQHQRSLISRSGSAAA